MSSKNAKQSAKMICNYLKTQPGRYSPDPKLVQKALHLSDDEFTSGLAYCIEKKIIMLDKTEAPAPAATAPRSSSVFSESVSKIFSEDFDEDEVKGTAEVAAVSA